MMDFGEALINEFVNAVGEVVSAIINWILRKLGSTEIETKRIKKYVFWVIVSVFIVFLFWLTIRYS